MNTPTFFFALIPGLERFTSEFWEEQTPFGGIFLALVVFLFLIVLAICILEIAKIGKKSND